MPYESSCTTREETRIDPQQISTSLQKVHQLTSEALKTGAKITRLSVLLAAECAYLGVLGQNFGSPKLPFDSGPF